MIINLHPDKIIKILLIIICFLFIANTFGLVLKYFYGYNKLLGLIPLFILDYEGNIPTWYSSITLFICSILLMVISFAKKKKADQYYLHWSTLSIIFLYLSIDEASEIHELTIRPLQNLFNLGGIFLYSWVIIAIPLILIFVTAYTKFIIDLPKKTQFGFILSGILYVGGAIGIELIGGWYNSVYLINSWNLIDTCNFIYMVITTCEEILEMLGIAVFLYSLLNYIHFYVNEVIIHISEVE